MQPYTLVLEERAVALRLVVALRELPADVALALLDAWELPE